MAKTTSPTSPSISRNEDEWYEVFTPEFDTVAYDPLDPEKRYHTGISVELNRNCLKGKGTMFQVTGDIIAASGMRFEVKEDFIPAEERYFYRITHIGWIRKSDYPRFKGILEALPRPTKQQGLDFWSKDPDKRNKITWTKENGELYALDEQRRPVMKCNEWTHEVAIPKLRQEGVLHS